MRWCLHRPWVVIAVGVVVAASSVPMASNISFELLPSDVDEGEFEISVDPPEDVSLPSVDGVMRTIEAELQQVPAIRTMLTQIGGGFSRQPAGTSAVVPNRSFV